MKSKKILILELADNLIKVCQVTITKKRKVIDIADVVELTHGAAPEDIADIFSKFSKTKYEKIIISLPRILFLMRFLRLPSHQEAELAKMLPFQLSKIIPYPLGEIIHDFSVAEIKKAYSEIVVFLIHRKKIDIILDSIKKSHINIDLITMSSRGLWQLLTCKNRLSGITDSAPVMLLDIDKYSAEFLAVSKSGIMFSRLFPYSDNRSLLKGINQSLVTFEKKFGKRAFAKVFLTGNRQDNVIDKLNFDTPVFIDAEKDFVIGKNAKDKIENGLFSFASVLGLSIDSDSDKFDFSPKALKQKRRGEEKKKRYFKIAIVIFEIILICGIFLFKYMFDRYSYREFLDLKLEEIKVEAKELDRVAGKLKILDKKLRGQAPFAEILYNIISSISENTQLTVLDFQENEDFFLKGYAEDASSVFEMVTSLNNSEFFKEVKVKYASKIKRNDKTIIEFLIFGSFKK